jgi:hypothetical protein
MLLDVHAGDGNLQDQEQDHVNPSDDLHNQSELLFQRHLIYIYIIIR